MSRPSTGIAALNQPSRRDLVVAGTGHGYVPAHRVGQPIVHVEEKRHFKSVVDGGTGDTRSEDRSHVVDAEVAMIQRHFSQQAERRAQFGIDRGGGILV